MPFRRLFAAAVSALLCGCASTPAPPPTEAPADLVITDVTAIDGVSGAREDVDVVVAGDTIVAVVPAGEAGSGLQVIDGAGRYLIPGLWDAHVHLAYDEAIDETVFFPLAVAHGVTSLRDTGGMLERLAAARARARDDALAPSLYVSGPLLDGEKVVYDGSPGRPHIGVAVTDAAAGRRAVDNLAAQGVDLIKAYEMLSPDTFAAIVSRARERGLPVAVHSPLAQTAAATIAQGPLDMQHLRNLEMDCVADPAPLLAAREAALATNAAGGPLRAAIHAEQRQRALAIQDEAACAALIALMKERGVVQTPTLAITLFFLEQRVAAPAWRATFALMPPAVATRWQGGAERIGAMPAPSDDALSYARWTRAMVARLDDAGVPILAGTDAPIGFLTPGAALHAELALLVEAGLSPMAALRAATLAPAQFMGIADRVGTIAPGMRADLVLLAADPLADIANTRAIDMVVLRGTVIDRAGLDALRDAPGGG